VPSRSFDGGAEEEERTIDPRFLQLASAFFLFLREIKLTSALQ
jgi:hypothetical protein